MTKYALQQSLSVELLKGEEDGEKREGRDTGRGGGGPLEDEGGVGVGRACLSKVRLHLLLLGNCLP